MKEISGFEGKYFASEDGRIFSVKNNKFLKPVIDSDGYQIVTIKKNNCLKRKNYKVHRLIAETFILNINNKQQINHKDSNRVNNNINNLEWSTPKENIIHSFEKGFANIRAKKQKKKVYCIELNRVFDSATDAAEILGIDNSLISRCCRGKSKTAGKFRWKLI